MHTKCFFAFCCWLASSLALADSVYCPKGSGYIQEGMSQDAVLNACGQPLSKKPSDAPVFMRVPVTQLIYSALNTGSVYPQLNSAFYNQWSLPSGTSGILLEVDVVDNQIDSIRINGSDTNVATLCDSGKMQVGDTVDKAYAACGSPSMVNQTYVNRRIPQNQQPEVWIYQFTPYQPAISLTFIKGKLESISR